MKRLIYKSREEEVLIESLAKSQLISREQLLYIKKLYNENVPYHNFLHALKVAEGVLKLPRDLYNIIEIQSLFISALFHDAGHTGTAGDLDEFRSLDMAFQGIIDFEKKYDYAGIDYSIVRKSIIWTVFKNRASNKDPYAVLLADIDVSTVWMSFPEFLYYCDFPISLEFKKEIHEWLKDVSYFKFLMWVDKNIFRTEKLREVFPEYLKNARLYMTINLNKIDGLYKYWMENDITYKEFEIYYKKLSI